MDETSRIESDLSSIFADSDLLEGIFESVSPFTRPSSSQLPGMMDPDTTAVAAYKPPDSKRGGRHISLGIYIGGFPLMIDYKLKKPYSYRSIFQVQTPKAIATAKKTLYDSKLNTTQVKFNGSLELTKDSLSAGTELDKVDFLRALRTLIGRFGLETFFYMPLAGSMKFLISDAHHFTVDEIIAKHNACMEIRKFCQGI